MVLLLQILPTEPRWMKIQYGLSVDGFIPGNTACLMPEEVERINKRANGALTFGGISLAIGLLLLIGTPLKGSHIGGVEVTGALMMVAPIIILLIDR